MERGAHTGAGLLAGPVAHGGSMLEQSVPEGLHLLERTHDGAVLEGLQPMRGTNIGAASEGLYPVGGITCWCRATA